MEIYSSWKLTDYLENSPLAVFDEAICVKHIEGNHSLDPHEQVEIKGKTFLKSFSISGGWEGVFNFEGCRFKLFEITSSTSLEGLTFVNCEIDSLNIDASGVLSRLVFERCGRLGTMEIRGLISISKFEIWDCLSISSLTINGSVESIDIDNELAVEKGLGERGFIPNPEQELGTFNFFLTKTKSFQVKGIKVTTVGCFGATEALSLELSNSFIYFLHISGFKQCNSVFENIRWEDDSRRAVFSFSDSDLSLAKFHGCDFGERGQIVNSKLEACETLNTRWPKDLYGSKIENQYGFRQLKLLHKNLGDYRGQFEYYMKEMNSFRLSEKEVLRSTRKRVSNVTNFLNWVAASLEYLIRVLLPFSASRFGLQTWRPLGWFFLLQLVAVSLLIFYQGDELGIDFSLSWPREWDYNLFFHVLLPTHRGTYHGVVLLEWIDISWKVVSAYLIYHIVTSSRRLTKL